MGISYRITTTQLQFIPSQTQQLYKLNYIKYQTQISLFVSYNMGPKKLNARQQQAKAEKEAQLRFTRQQGSIQMLSQPSSRQLQTLREQEEIADVLGGSPVANKGLHLAAEHEIITRDMPDPNVLGQFVRKKAHQDIQAWDSPEREQSQLSMIQGSGGKESKRNSSVIPGIQMGRRDSEELQAYSRQELGIDDSSVENQQQIKQNTGSRSKFSGPTPNTLRSEQKLKAFKDKKTLENQQITVENYTRQGESERDVHQRMQQSVIDKTREKNLSTNENKDLQVSKDKPVIDTAKANTKGIEGKQRASKTQVAFDDQIGLEAENSRGSTGAGKTKGILKSQKNGANSRDQSSGVGSPNRSDTESNQGTLQKAQPPVGSRLTNALGSGGESSIFSASAQQIPVPRYTTGQKLQGQKPHFSNLPLTGLESSSAASAADDLQIFHKGKVNQRREPIVRPPSSHLDDADGDLGMDSSKGLSKKRMRAESEKPKELTWRDTMQGIEEEKQAAIDRRMRYMVYQYTRPGGILEQEESLNKTIDYSGIGYLEGLIGGDDRFANGVMDAQDRKLARMKNKLNQSVDFVQAKQNKSTIEENRIAREKAKFEQLASYKKVSEAMTYRNEIYEQNIERALDPVNSPLQPAAYARQKQENERHKTRAREELANSDAYSARMDEVDRFLGRKAVSHAGTLKELGPAGPTRSSQQKAEGKHGGDSEAAGATQTPSESDGRSPKPSPREPRHLVGVQGAPDAGLPTHAGPESGLEIYRIPEATEEHLETQSPRESNRKAPRGQNLGGGRGQSMVQRGRSGNRLIADLGRRAEARYEGLGAGSSVSQEPTDPLPREDGSMQQAPLDGEERRDIKESEVDLFLGTDAKDDVVEQGEDATKSEELSPEGGGPPDLSLYNIRNYPKLPPQTKLTAERREISGYSSKQVSGAKEEMRQAEKVFKMIHDYCRENLTVSYNLLDKHVEDLLDPDAVVSPLLKYFNDLARHSNFRLPSLAVLEFDQRFFKRYVERLRGAQQVEVRWVRAQTAREARKTLMTAFDQARALLQGELKSTLYKYEQMEEQLALKEKENEKLVRRIISMEVQIEEQRAYTKATISKTFNDDHELFLANGGPGGAYEQYNNGDVLQDIDTYHSRLKEHTQFTIDIINADIKEQGTEALKNAMQDSLRDAGRAANRSRTNAPSAMRDSLGFSGREDSPPGSPERALGGNAPSSKYRKPTLPGFPLLDPEALLPSKEELITQLEPFLKPATSLYGGSLRLSLQDRQAVMAQEMYKHHKMTIKRLVDKNEAQRAENFANAVLMEELNITNDRLQKENDRYVFEIRDLKAKFAADKARIKQTAKDRLREIQEACETELARAKGLLGLELKVTGAVTERLIKDNEVQAVKLRKFATLLRIPRLHWDYIEKHGVDEFVDYCEDIVRRERAVKMAQEAEKKKLELRTDYAILKKSKNVGGFSERYRHNMTDVKASAPFELQVPADKRREDHPSHGKAGARSKLEKDNEAVRRQLERVALLQNTSLLDLSELLRKHKHRQPQLLATLQPDLKTQLLHNPLLMKSLEKIERQDPVNKRASEIKELIQSLKAERYERKFFTPFPELESAQTTKLSKSVIFDDSKIENAFNTPGNNRTFKSILEQQLANSNANAHIRYRPPQQFQTMDYSSGNLFDKSPKDDETVIIQLNTHESEQKAKQQTDKKKFFRLNQTSLTTLNQGKSLDERFDTSESNSENGFPTAQDKQVKSGAYLTNQLSAAQVAGRLKFNMRNVVSTKVFQHGLSHLFNEKNEKRKLVIQDSNLTSNHEYPSILKTHDNRNGTQNISPNRDNTLATLNPFNQHSGSQLKKSSVKNLTAEGSSNHNLAPVKEVDTLKIPMQQSLQNLGNRSGNKPNNSVLTQKLSDQ